MTDEKEEEYEELDENIDDTEEDSSDEDFIDDDPEDDESEDDGVVLPLEKVVEALLISAPEPKTAKQLAKNAGKGIKAKLVDEAVEKLNAEYTETGRAFEIVKVNEAYQIMTLPEYFQVVGNVVKKTVEAKKLSPASLDTLAIIAYKQPIMRVDIETIRGVACGQVLRGLIELEMIKVVGKNTEIPGQPMLYGTTDNFMEKFGISSIEELPNIAELRRD